jgi:DNA modification methylase
VIDLSKPFRAMLLSGDSSAVLRKLPADSIDSVVTDPPYDLTANKAGGSGTSSVNLDSPYGRARIGTGNGSGGFMGKAWDATGIAFDPAFWREVGRVLKPGGHLLAFGGTRTYHRMASAIEDAGFEIRDSVHWVYGCLSADTDALTRRGWVAGTALTPEDEVAQWDSTTGTLSWVRPSRILVAPYTGPMMPIVNRNTAQLLTPDHRVYAKIKHHSRHKPLDQYETVSAAEVVQRSKAWSVTLPCAGVLTEGTAIDPEYAYIVGWWLTDAWLHGDGKACMFSQSKPATLAKLQAALAPYNPSRYCKPGKKETHADEYTFYLTGPLALQLRTEFPARRLPWAVLGWDYAARMALYRGLMDGDGSQPVDKHAHTFWSKDPERRDVFLALATSLGFRSFIGTKDCVFVNTETTTTQVQGKHRTHPVDYTGQVWCVTVPTGAFVARRHGRPFITGNSGFPKSMDISKAIDKMDRIGPMEHRARQFTAWMRSTGITAQQINEATRSFMGSHYLTAGSQPAVATADLFDLLRPLLPPVPAEIEELVHSRTIEAENMKRRAVVGAATVPLGHAFAGAVYGRDSTTRTVDVTAPHTDAAKQWAGWGTALKPSHEPIVVARKPLIGTVAANVLAHGTGALNIDGCRIKPVAGEVVACGLADPANRQGVFGGTVFNQTSNKERFQQVQRESIERTNTLGRWPANTLLTHGPNCDAGGCAPGCPVAEMDRQSGSVGAAAPASGPTRGTHGNGIYNPAKGATNEPSFFADKGGASRFFNVFEQDNDPNDPLWSAPPFVYVAKPARSERDAGCEDLPTRTAQETVGRDPDSAGAKNPRAGAGRGANAPLYYCTHCNVSLQGGRAAAVCAESADGKHTPEARGVLQGVLNPHPTVKPVALMRHLCLLVTPPGGIVLDPFGGSGTTGCAAVLEGFRPILIEREAEYLPVIQARLKHWTAKAKASGGTNGGEGER